MDRTGPRPGRISAGPVAGYYRAFVLQLSRDGRTRHNFHCRDGLGCVAVVAGEGRRLPIGAVGGPVMRFSPRPFQYPRKGERPDVGAAPALLLAQWVPPPACAAGAV